MARILLADFEGYLHAVLYPEKHYRILTVTISPALPLPHSALAPVSLVLFTRCNLLLSAEIVEDDERMLSGESYGASWRVWDSCPGPLTPHDCAEPMYKRRVIERVYRLYLG